MPPQAKAQPKALERLIAKLQAAIGVATTDLQDGNIDVQVWRDTMEQALTKHAAAAYLAGQGGRQMSLDEMARKRISGVVAVQMQYLDNFSAEIQSNADFEKGWIERAKSYADAIVEPFWAGRTKMLPLPALPGDGTTQCGQRCKCLWSIDTIDAEQGSYDCYWIRSSKDPCQSCVERASQWSPLQIRNGVLQ